MLGFLSRLVGLWLVALGFVLVIVDGSRTIADGSLSIVPLGELLFEINPALLNQMQAGVERNLHPVVWDPVIQSVLRLPGWLAISVLGAVFLFFGRKRVPVEYEV